MNLYFRLALIVLAVFVVSCTERHVIHAETEPGFQLGQLQLDAPMRGLLQQEMQAIQTGMMSLVPAIASGDWQKVSEIAKNIEGSYLLKQKLTTAQHHALHSVFKFLAFDFYDYQKINQLYELPRLKSLNNIGNG